MAKIVSAFDKRVQHAVKALIDRAYISGDSGMHRDTLVNTVVGSYKVKPSDVRKAITELERIGKIERCGMGNRYRLAVQS